MNKIDLEKCTVAELRVKAEALGIEKLSKLKKSDLISEILSAERKEQDDAPKITEKPIVKKLEKKKEPDLPLCKENQTAESKEQPERTNNNRYAKIKDSIEDTTEIEGRLEVLPEGFGFIKTESMQSQEDWVYVSGSQIQKFKLQTGNIIGGKVRKAKPGEKYAAMLFLEKVNGMQTSDIINKINSMLYVDDKKDMDRFKNSQEGILDVNSDGFGFLRTNHYLSGDHDIYVAPNQIRRFNLRTGDKIIGKIRMPNEGEKFDALLYVERVNGDIPEKIANRPKFERLTPIFPEERISLETDRDIISTRIIDLFSPI
ncbi:MAG: Rho termination factor N-terminal domain-containing protein, partial [Eubacterium sp.]